MPENFDPKHAHIYQRPPEDILPRRPGAGQHSYTLRGPLGKSARNTGHKHTLALMQERMRRQ
eukprot:3278836-Alexandrium_andersonii.AAC.1